LFKKQFTSGDGRELNRLFGGLSLPIQLQIKDAELPLNKTFLSPSTIPKAVKPYIFETLFRRRSKNYSSGANDTHR